jgi:hypothetical protein
MREDLKILEKIDQYLASQMSGTELSGFENEIQNNPTLKSQVDSQQLIIQAAKRQVLSNQINAASNGGGFFKFNWTLGVGLIFLLIAIVTFTQLDIEKANNVEDIELGVSIDAAETEVTEVLNYQVEEAILVDTISDIITKPTVKRRIQAPFKIPEADTNSQSSFEFYDFNGLKCWEKPNIQSFEIDANITETIEGENGTLVIIPKNSFLDEKGNKVNGKVNFELVEAYELSDMVLYNLTTTSNGNVLETGGMFYTNATQKGKQLTVDPNKPMMIQVPCVEEKPDMMAFESEIDSAGTINWKNPKPLEQFLTKVEMNLLNFLPTGFENEVYASMPMLGYEKADTKVVYDMYYSFGYEKKYYERKQGTLSKVLGHFLYPWIYREKNGMLNSDSENIERQYERIPIDTVECGLNPLSIKPIRENPDYANSFLATKEFEERLVELHQLENGQAMLDVYLENLDKNLWVSDSIVAEMIINKRNDPAFKDKGNLLNMSSRARKKNIFDIFFSQRKTKVRDADLYAEALTKYYNTKKQEYKDEMEGIRQKNNLQLAREVVKLKDL